MKDYIGLDVSPAGFGDAASVAAAELGATISFHPVELIAQNGWVVQQLRTDVDGVALSVGGSSALGPARDVTISFGGQESSSLAGMLTWTVLMKMLNPEQEDPARAEAVRKLMGAIGPSANFKLNLGKVRYRLFGVAGVGTTLIASHKAGR